MDYNHSCLCSEVDLAGLYSQVPELKEKQLFAAWSTYIKASQALQMQKLIQAIESVVHLPAYKQAVLAKAPPIAHYSPGALSVFLGYDFHLTPQGPQLIEINTNAGGALLNGLLADVNQPCCLEPLAKFNLIAYQQELVDMFRNEWRLQRGMAPLARIAIVDQQPSAQHFYPEFKLFQHLFASQGIKTIIADPQELQLKNQGLYYGDLAIDLVYNRLTDFYLTQAQHAHIAEAYLTDKIVLTPHPHAYALYADKRNLSWLSNAQQLTEWKVAAEQQELLLQGIPSTFIVQKEDEQQIWQQRKQLFFKPVSGYGGKGSYRGDSIRHKAFANLLQQDYIAQRYAPPSTRLVAINDKQTTYKVDVRNYVYNAKVQLLAARLYQGQTTNFRTVGSGFSPAIIYSA